MRRNIVYEVKYSIHLNTRCIGIEFCRVPFQFGFCWNEISDKSAKQGAMKNMSELSHNNLLLSPHEIASIIGNPFFFFF